MTVGRRARRPRGSKSFAAGEAAGRPRGSQRSREPRPQSDAPNARPVFSVFPEDSPSPRTTRAGSVSVVMARSRFFSPLVAVVLAGLGAGCAAEDGAVSSPSYTVAPPSGTTPHVARADSTGAS